MRILVCVKQVPDTMEIRLDPVRGTMIREGVPTVLNPYDRYALEMAVRVGGSPSECEITALSMGPAQAEAVLRDCLALGANRAVLLCDPAFGGSDTLATSYILSRAVARLEEREGRFDLIFCGKQATDGDTAQVGPELAEHLGLPQMTNLVEVSAEGTLIVGKRDSGGEYELLECAPPCLLTVTKPFFELRYPSLKSKLAAKRAAIGRLSADALDIDLARVGLKGSPTRVVRCYPPEGGKDPVWLQGKTEELAKRLTALIGGEGRGA